MAQSQTLPLLCPATQFTEATHPPHLFSALSTPMLGSELKKVGRKRRTTKKEAATKSIPLQVLFRTWSKAVQWQSQLFSVLV